MSATLTIPVADWNDMVRRQKRIEIALGAEGQTKVEWVKVGVLIKLGWGREQIRYRRNSENSRSKMVGKKIAWEYDKSKFLKQG